MKMKLVLVFALLFSGLARADLKGYRIDTAVSSLSTSWVLVTDSTSNAQFTGVRNLKSILVDNRTAGEIGVECSTGTSTTAPASNSVHATSVGAGQTIAIDNANLSGTCYVKGQVGSISSLVIQFTAVTGG